MSIFGWWMHDSYSGGTRGSRCRPPTARARGMSRLELATYVRGLLGRGFSVADEEGALDGELHLVVLRRGSDKCSSWTFPTSGFAAWGMCFRAKNRMLLKHLAISARRYFSRVRVRFQRPRFRGPGPPRADRHCA